MERSLQTTTIMVAMVIPVLLVFWLWMFRDMIYNDYLLRWPYWDVTGYDSLPNRRLNWMLAFVFLNIFAAAIYYFTDYRYRHHLLQ